MADPLHVPLTSLLYLSDATVRLFNRWSASIQHQESSIQHPAMKLPPDTCPILTNLSGIDLNRHLELPHGSLTPGCHPEPRWHALRSLSEAERIEARQDAEDTARVIRYAGYAFLAFTALTYAATKLGWL